MNQIQLADKFHKIAEVLMDDSFLADRRGEHELALCYTDQAYRIEAKAAKYATGAPLSQGVLYRSAAWLALSSGHFKKAVELAMLGLEIEGVAEEIREELREVLAVAKGALCD